MEALIITIISLSISLLILPYIFISQSYTWSSTISNNNNPPNTKTKKLPPGPPRFLILSNLIWFGHPISQIESLLRRAKTRCGPLITLKIGTCPFVFIASRSLAHHALVRRGAVFADRPAPAPTTKVLDRTQLAITSAAYGTTWSLLRRNLTHRILNPAHVRFHSTSRRGALSVLLFAILETVDQSARPIDHFRHAVFCLLARMCFGNELQEKQVKEIESVQCQLIHIGLSKALNLCPPRLSKILFYKRWDKLIQLRKDQERLLIPIIRTRLKSERKCDNLATAYVDTLADLQLPEEKNRLLEEWEIMSLCSEFLTAGTDTTSTALQWIMANLVKYTNFQVKLYREITSVIGPPPPIAVDKRFTKVVEEEDLKKMPYLKAVVLEGLRRHPPTHFLLPHKVTRDVELDDYIIPKNTTVNFMVAEMGWDPTVWEDSMEFNPDRFLDEASASPFDLTGSREIKMMPFGAGRRICPAYSLALLHLEYFVANLIWYFEWMPLPGEEIDLTEKQEFTKVMKNPLRACITPRIK